MVKAVFVQNRVSAYADQPGVVYNFPSRNYLSVAEQTVGDWVLLFESGKGGGAGYFAVQQVSHIAPAGPGRHNAHIVPGSLWDFEQAVSRTRGDGSRRESTLPAVRGKNTSAIRLISDRDFAAIVEEGLRELPGPETLPRTGPLPGFAAPATAFEPDPLYFARPDVLTQRKWRDPSFSRQVRRAYGNRCAISGLQLTNGGGRPEVEAAHIRPITDGGPDSVTNGLALSGTLHWMFDRGLIGVADDHAILISHNKVSSDVVKRLISPDMRLRLPADPRHHPHAAFLQFHRETIYGHFD